MLARVAGLVSAELSAANNKPNDDQDLKQPSKKRPHGTEAAQTEDGFDPSINSRSTKKQKICSP